MSLLRLMPAATIAAIVLAGCSPAPVKDAPASDEATVVAGSVIAGKADKAVLKPADAQCAGGEQTVFSCKLSSGRRASVCVTGGDSGFAQYRFGKDGAVPELTWPATAASGTLEWASVPYSGGGEAQISFARGDTRYIIYSRIIRTNFAVGEPNNPAIEDGVLVQGAGDKTTDLRCDDPDVAPVNVNLAEKHAARSEGLFTYGE